MDEATEALTLFLSDSVLRLEGTVRRVTASVASVDLPSPWAPASFSARGVPLRPGEQIKLAGVEDAGLALDLGKGFRVLALELERGQGSQYFLIRKPTQSTPEAPAVEPSAPAWVAALVTHGLLVDTARVRPAMYTQSPVGVLCTTYLPRQALARGFVYYSPKWQRDTDDPLRDFATIADAPGVFRTMSIHEDTLEFKIALSEGRYELDRADVHVGNLDHLVERVNVWLERLGAERRIFRWESDTDKLVFLGRTPNDVQIMRRDGLAAERAITQPGVVTPPLKDETDWSDL